MSQLPTHSKIGASSFHRWGPCPGSVKLCAKIPPTTSAYADEGTLGHSAGEHFLNKGKWPEGISQEMIDAVSIYTDYVIGLKNVCGISNVWIENRFDLSQLHPGLYGTADCVAYDPKTKRLTVADLKYGVGVYVSPEENEQLMYYGLGALLSSEGLEIEEVELVIVQPRFEGADPIRKWVLPTMDLIGYANDLVEKAKATEEPNAPIVPGDHCRFCPAKPICPALKELALLSAKAEFAEPETLPAESLSTLMVKLPAIESWVKAVREAAYNMAKRGEKVPGFKIVEKRATRKWADPVEAQRELRNKFEDSVYDACLTEPELKSVAQVEKLLGKKNMEILNGLYISVSSGDVLVPDSDNRSPVVRTSAAEDFE